MAVKPFTLTLEAVRAAVRELEHIDVPSRTLAGWVEQGYVTPSVYRATRRGDTARWSVADVAKVRLVARLRYGGKGKQRVSGPRLRVLFAYLEKELAEVFRPGSGSTLVVDGARPYVVRRGQTDVEIPSGQYRLQLDAFFEGNDAVAKKVRRAA